MTIEPKQYHSRDTDIEVLEHILADRQSCRAFKPHPVPREIIVRILAAAQRTASNCNAQPWHIYIISAAAAERLREAMYAQDSSGAPNVYDITPIQKFSGPFKERQSESGWQLFGSLGIKRGDREASGRQSRENFRFFGAPHLAVLTTHASLGTPGTLDTGAYLSNFMLAAQALGVGTVAQGSIARRVDVIRAHFDIPAERHVVCGISFGFPDYQHAVNSYRTSRATISEASTFFDS